VRIADEFDYGDFVVTGADWVHMPPMEPAFRNEFFVVFSMDDLRSWAEEQPGCSPEPE
jgi:hypothetical protein